MIDYYSNILGKPRLEHNQNFQQDEQVLSSGEPFAAKVRRVGVLSAVQAAAQSVRDAIISGELRPGARLVERDLAEALGIGQPTLREALKELEYQGLVRKLPRKGTYVASFTRDDVRKIMMVRMVLEALAVQLATLNMTPSAELRLGALVERMSAGADDNDLVGFHDADVEFHREIWRLAGNEYLLTSLEAMVFRQLVLGVPRHSHGRFLAAVKQHREILKGLCSHDPEKARAIFISETIAFWNEQAQLDLEAVVSTGVVLQRRGPPEDLSEGLRAPTGQSHSKSKTGPAYDEDGGIPTNWNTGEPEDGE